MNQFFFAGNAYVSENSIQKRNGIAWNMADEKYVPIPSLKSVLRKSLCTRITVNIHRNGTTTSRSYDSIGMWRARNSFDRFVYRSMDIRAESERGTGSPLLDGVKPICVRGFHYAYRVPIRKWVNFGISRFSATRIHHELCEVEASAADCLREWMPRRLQFNEDPIGSWSSVCRRNKGTRFVFGWQWWTVDVFRPSESATCSIWRREFRSTELRHCRSAWCLHQSRTLHWLDHSQCEGIIFSSIFSNFSQIEVASSPQDLILFCPILVNENAL